MALRDQPYLPLYIQDIMTDEKLNECSAATHGIFIKGIMCLMHKSEEYGKILLKQKDKQSTDQIKNFAFKLDKHLPYSVEEIERALAELLTEKVLYIQGDALCQKRMIRDNALSELRAKAGKKGAEQKEFFAKAKAYTNDKAKQQANTEYENESENEVEFKYELKENSEKSEPIAPEVPRGTVEMTDEWFASIFDDKYMSDLIFPFRGVDIKPEFEKFKVKVRGDPDRYGRRDSGGIRSAFLYHLNQVKPGKPVKTISQDRINEFKNFKI